MSINKVQFQEGYSILELFDNYGTDEQCRQTLFDLKFKNGFVCSKYGTKAFCELKSASYINVIAATIKLQLIQGLFLIALSYR